MKIELIVLQKRNVESNEMRYYILVEYKAIRISKKFADQLIKNNNLSITRSIKVDKHYKFYYQ